VLRRLIPAPHRGRKALRRLFQRSAVPQMLRGRHWGRPLPAELVSPLLDAARADPEALLKQLHSHADGLSAAQARAMRRKSGRNEVAREAPVPWPLHLWHCYRNPFNLLLSALAAVSAFTHDARAALVIGAMVALSTLMRFVQEARAHRSAEALRGRVGNRATVLRRGHVPAQLELPITQLVPGDIVKLAAGDMVPADLRLLAAKDLFVDQSAMTGESLPVEKFAHGPAAGSTDAASAPNLCLMATHVTSGSATAVVVATGMRTVFGTLAEHATRTATTPTAFQVGIDRVSWLLIRFMLVMVPIVFVLNGLTKHDWLQALLFALSIAVGLTPEMLPMIVTSTLARGAVVLSRRKVIVKRLDAIQNFGAMDLLCTDKTGTLTQDRIALARHSDTFGNESAQVLELAYLNSHFQTGLRNLLDAAVLAHAELHPRLGVAENFRKVDEVPFDFQRRRMSVVVARTDGSRLLICKGAVEEVTAVCTSVRREGGDVPLDETLRARVHAVTAGLNRDGLRVVAVAVREFPPGEEAFGAASETGLTLVGHIAFLDPPKDSAAPAVAALAARGVAVKVLTGDNLEVTTKVCRDVGLAVTGSLQGSDIEAMDDAQLAAAVEVTTVFAKLDPLHKERIVRALRANGHVTGFMGDGINDAAALHAADVGISVDTGVDIAKEAADIILLEKSLAVLEQGVIEGRRTFVNMLKYIRITASSNFGNVLSVLVASAFLPFLPMLPIHLLVQNLLYDLAQTAIPFDSVDDESLRTPQHWEPHDLPRFMLHFGPVSSVFDVLTFALLWMVLQANTPAVQTLFQTGWFAEGLLSQTLAVLLLRSRGWPLLHSRPAAPLLAAAAAVAALAVVLPASPRASALQMQPLPGVWFAWLAGLMLAYALSLQLAKHRFCARYGWR
jgi:P-type Mg2+ transporter